MKIEKAQDVRNYYKYYEQHNNEVLLILSLDKDMNVIQRNLINEGTEDFVKLDSKYTEEILTKNNAYYFILMHNHPYKDVHCVGPSFKDNIVTCAYNHFFKQKGFIMLDHIIFNSESFFSYYNNDFLKEYTKFTENGYRELDKYNDGLSEHHVDDVHYYYQGV